jgi:hypothetical protein
MKNSIDGGRWAAMLLNNRGHASCMMAFHSRAIPASACVSDHVQACDREFGHLLPKLHLGQTRVAFEILGFGLCVNTWGL